MTNLNHEIRELTLQDVSGGVMGWDDILLSVAIGVVANALSNCHGISDSINYIKQHA
jgi:hypothetical protein